MSKIFPQGRSVFVRELFSYFNSPIACIFIIVFVILTSGLYMTEFFLAGSADMRSFFGSLPLILCVFIPAVTMRLWAEERRGNTFELLLTFPMPSWKLVLGKFFASFVFYFLTLAATCVIPLMLSWAGQPDPGPIIGGYLGALLMGGFFLSIGIFISGLSKDQIVAFIVAMIVCFFFYLAGMDFIAALIDGWVPGAGTFLKNNFGMTRHFSSFEKGVIDNTNVFYFILMTGLFLLLNIFAIEDRMRPKARWLLAGAVTLCLSIGALFNSLVMDLPLGRFDLTQGKIYTITPATQKILHSLKSPVSAKVFLSPPDKMPTAFRTLEQEIRDQLEEIKILSKGKFEYRVIHMEAVQDSAEKEKSDEDRLQKKGIVPFQVQSIEQDELGIKLIYSAIALAYKDRPEEVIPRVTTADTGSLEYEIMSKVYRMTLAKKPIVALAAPYEEKTVDPQMMAVFRQFGKMPENYREDHFQIVENLLQYEGYETRRIRLTEQEPIPPEAASLVILAPENLNERQQYEIDRFLHNGGRVVLAAQGYEYEYNPVGRQGVNIIPRALQTGVNKLLQNYGISVADELLMDERHEVINISGGMNFGPFAVSIPVKAPMHILVPQESMNPRISVTGRLSSLFYLWGSALKINEDKLKEFNLKQTTLFTSSKESWSVPFRSGPLGKSDIQHMGSAYEGPKPLAILVEGQFPNSFADKPLPTWPAPNPEETPSAQEETRANNPQPGRLIVVGCAKMFEEQFIKAGGAMTFLLNAVDAVTLGEELINIRSRGPVNRSIIHLSKMQKIWYRFLTIFFVPLLITAAGALRVFLRQREKDQYVKAMSFKTV